MKPIIRILERFPVRWNHLTDKKSLSFQRGGIFSRSQKSATFVENALRTAALFAAIFAAGVAGAAEQAAISPKGVALVHELDSLGVETKWNAGVHIDWDTGIPDGAPEMHAGRHTHCSAFVASAAKHLGVYMLRPPEHGQLLLANAQNEWLAEEGGRDGWRELPDPAAAQRAANRGDLVVATYHNHRDSKPGHIAIVRPSAKSLDAIASEGPDIIMAGTVNYASTTVLAGFAGHPSAWGNNEIGYYAHSIKLGQR